MARQLAWSLCSQSPHDKTVVAQCAQWRPLPSASLDKGEELSLGFIGHGSGKLSSSPSREKSRCWIRVLKDIPGCYHTSL